MIPWWLAVLAYLALAGLMLAVLIALFQPPPPSTKAPVLRRCKAQDWAYADDGTPIVYGTCDIPLGIEHRWHREWRDGQVWAEWTGPADRRAPQDARDQASR